VTSLSQASKFTIGFLIRLPLCPFPKVEPSDEDGYHCESNFVTNQEAHVQRAHSQEQEEIGKYFRVVQPQDRFPKFHNQLGVKVFVALLL
jgi:hypothetical protein